jgi:hypothetical protein
MELSPKKLKPPNPNGNPNFKPKWSTATTPIRVPENLADTLISLARQVDTGKLKQSDLNKLCLNPSEIELELGSITGNKPHLEIVPDPIPADDSHAIALKLIEQFEEEQRKSWGKAAKQTGEFNTNSPRWTKYNDFKAWVKSNA